MNPFEALYVKKCNTPLSQSYLVNRVQVGPAMLKDMEQQVQIKRKK